MGQTGRRICSAALALLAVSGAGWAVSGGGGATRSAKLLAAREQAAAAETELRDVLGGYASHENAYREARLRWMRATTDQERVAAEAERVRAQEWVRLYGNIVERKMRDAEEAETALAVLEESMQLAGRD